MNTARALVLGAVSVLAAACSSSPSGAPPQTKAEPKSSPGDAPVKPVDPTPPATPLDATRTHLLALRHTPNAEKMQLQPLTIADGGVVQGPEVEHPAIPLESWPGHYGALVGHGGGMTWVRAAQQAAGYQVVVAAIGETVERVVATPLQPASVHVVGGGVIVGAGNTVGWIDLNSPTPVWVEVHRREEMRNKAYDLFARSGDWLVAIDDVVVPMYADSFRLGAGGRPTHTAGWSLPGVINGHYTMAALRRAGDKDGVLFTVTPYGIMSGNGQDLAAIKIAGDALVVKERTVLNGSRSAEPAVLEEHVSRQTGKAEQLAAGTGFTPWRGLALHGERVLLAAGTRGLLVVPQVFTPDTKAVVVDVGGECRDVLVADERTWVLVGGSQNAVVELTWDGQGAHERGRTLLSDSYEQWVR